MCSLFYSIRHPGWEKLLALLKTSTTLWRIHPNTNRVSILQATYFECFTIQSTSSFLSTKPQVTFGLGCACRGSQKITSSASWFPANFKALIIPPWSGKFVSKTPFRECSIRQLIAGSVYDLNARSLKYLICRSPSSK